MTDTTLLKLPYIEAGQAQKHVTHNEALRMLDAVIQISVRDANRTAPPASPASGDRHVVASGASGAWAGKAHAIAAWQDGAWMFLTPNTGWCVWSIADDAMRVFNGGAWRDIRTLAIDNASHVGINTSADSYNRLAVRSNAGLFAAVNSADGGNGNLQLQLSRENSTKTASIYFSSNYSGRAEFGLIGSDAFTLKVSPDGSSWTEGFNIDAATGRLGVLRGLSLSGVIAPAQLTADQNDFSPAGLSGAAVLQLSSGAARIVTGLAGGAEGRIVSVINVGSQTITLNSESASSGAANRFSFSANLRMAGKQSLLLRYDGTAQRWHCLAAAPGVALV